MKKEIQLYPRIVYKDGQEDTTVHNGQEFGQYIEDGWQPAPLTNKKPLLPKTESAKIDLSKVNSRFAELGSSHAAEIASVKSAHDAEIAKLREELEMKQALYDGLSAEHEELKDKLSDTPEEEGA